MEENRKNIYITGDISLDHFLIRGDRFYSDEQITSGTGMHVKNGGAYIIYELLRHIGSLKNQKVDKSGKIVKKSKVFESVFGYKNEIWGNLCEKNKYFVSVSRFPRLKQDQSKELLLRIKEAFGYGAYDNSFFDLVRYSNPVPSGTNVIVIDDAGLDFDNVKNANQRKKILDAARKIYTSDQNSVVVYKKSNWIGNKLFYEDIMKESSVGSINLITIVSIDDIRKQDVKVSAGLSWEQSALDLVSELRNNPSISNLLKSKFLVVTFKSAGAILIVNNGNDNYEYRLIFDPKQMEGEDTDKDSGYMMGNQSVFTAALVSKLELSPNSRIYNLEEAIKAGLTASRQLYETGFNLSGNIFSYPMEIIAKQIDTITSYKYSSAPVPDPAILKDNSIWSILLDNYSEREANEEYKINAIQSLAKTIVIKGRDVLQNVPCGEFGNLFTVDRMEIESLRNLKAIIQTYVNSKSVKKPLSIGVFGPPGAGKSFAVEEIGKGIMGEKYSLLTFNLSQFNVAEDLTGALHQVRDRVLKNEIPIVFWDEFDSQGYRWLQYLLAPMQDGAFQEGQISHPVGKCIFVFAGATSYSFERFGEFRVEDEKSKKDFIMKKGPDFKSRLNGYLNVLGPNKRQKFNPDHKTEEDKWVDDPTDFLYPVRRAIFIIGLLRLKKSDFPYRIDPGLLNALITTEKYLHGSRSLANLLTDIRDNSPRKELFRSWLPSKSTLGLYFKNPDDFYKVLIPALDFQQKSWDIAPLIHGYYRDKLINPTKEYDVEFNFLPRFIKESNVQAAMRIPEVLGEGNMKLVGKNSDEKLSKEQYFGILKANNSEKCEKMAEKEHILWKEFYELNGWEHDEKRSDYGKKHNCLVPYDELSENDKSKDKNMVSNYWEILDKAGYGIAAGTTD